MHRIRLMTYKGLIVTPDVAEVLRALEDSANRNGRWRINFIKPPEEPHSPLSLLPAGREIRFKFEKDKVGELDALYATWGCAVPLGFTPKLRDPLIHPDSTMYHYLGPWEGLYGKLLAEGRGHLAWPSVCTAAQVDVGVWEGGKEEPRFVQAQLHRVGRNPGPVDGIIGPRTIAAIGSLSLSRGSLTEIADQLQGMEPVESQDKVSRGHLHLPGCQFVVEGYGGVKAWSMQQGAGFEVSGPGRIVVDVR